MQVVLPEEALPVKLTFNPEIRMSDDDYYEFCMANPDVRFERTEDGEIIIVPPAGIESDYQSLDVASQLNVWARRDGRGKAFGPSAEFILPTRAALSPDAAWVSNERLAKLSKKERRRFAPVSPEFIIEVMSPSDRLRTAKEKMTTWIRGGVELAWLIQPDERTIFVYRPHQAEPTQLSGIPKLAGEGPVAGFELNLTDVWSGL